MDLSRIRSEFPVTKKWAFMDHASVAPMSKRACDAVRRYIDDIEASGDVNGDEWHRAYGRTRELAAGLIGSSPDEIAFVKNTSEGLSFVANGLDWRPGDNVVGAEREFPANVYPWMNLSKKGVEFRMVPERNGRICPDDIFEAVDSRTKLIALSFVEFTSGFRNDIAAIGEFCSGRDILFVVDAIQGLGALRLDVRGAGVDVLSSDSHKWLMGPEGIGIFYCSERAMERIEVTEIGWFNVVNPSDYLNYDLTLHPGARRFECGSLNTMGIYGLEGALELIRDVGIDFIEGRVLGLTDLLCEGLERKGYKIYSPRGQNERSGIVSFYSERYDSLKVYNRLREARIIVALRDGRIRVSPHYYNSEEEIERLLGELP